MHTQTTHTTTYKLLLLMCEVVCIEWVQYICVCTDNTTHNEHNTLTYITHALHYSHTKQKQPDHSRLQTHYYSTFLCVDWLRYIYIDWLYNTQHNIHSHIHNTYIHLHHQLTYKQITHIPSYQLLSLCVCDWLYNT